MSDGQTYVMPASPAQVGLWLLAELNPDSTAYHVPAAMRVTGPLDTAALERALHRLGERHEILRTTFTTTGGEVSQVLHPRPRNRVEHRDLRALGEKEAEIACRAACAAAAAEPFDLLDGPLLRTTFFRLADDVHVVLLLMHHIITDGWSMGVFLRELATLHWAESAGLTGEVLPPLPLQYADFAVWHQQWLDSGAYGDQLDYWRGQLADGDLVLELPADRVRPRVPTGRGGRVPARIAPDLADRIRTVAAGCNATPFMLVQAAFGAVLARNSGMPRVRIGVPTANRGHANTQDLIGFFANTVVVETDTGRTRTFADAVVQVRDRTAGALAHGDIPFGEVVRHLGGHHDRSRSPLFQAMVSVDNAPDRFVLAPGLEAERFDVPLDNAKFDLTLFIRETSGHTELDLEFSTDLFTTEHARSLLDQVLDLLQRGTAAPGEALADLLAVGADQQDLLLTRAAGPVTPITSAAVELFERQVATTPGAAALVDGDRTVTYAELDAMAGHVAATLAGHGITAGDLVAVTVPRSIELVAALLAVWKRGAAYLPLDPAQPRARLSAILTDARPAAILHTAGYGTGLADDIPVLDVCLPDGAPTAAPPSVSDGAGLAYVLYTSGSTGRPKGARITNSGLANYLTWAAAEYSPAAPPVAPLHTTIGFDLTVTSLWVPLISGGSVHLLAEDSPVDRLAESLTGPARPTLVKLTPAHLEAICRLLPHGALAGRRTVFVVGGEALAPSLVRRLFTVAPDARVVNEYGPTETVVGCCTASFTAADELGDRPGVPIGSPIANTRLYVVDESLRLVPAGVPGELVVGGAGVGLGYLHDPARTAAVFVPDPFSDDPASRLYRTGDIVRHLPDGQLEFVGRRDFQVKIRGQRIELAEVEAALRAVDGVSDAVAVAVKDEVAGTRLAAYVTGPVEAPAVRSALGVLLPDAMVPSAVTVLEKLPLTDNGKIDRSALPAPVFHEQSEYVAPVTSHERAVAGLFGEVLGVDRVGLTDDFFGLGGHSLLATQVMARVRERFSVGLPLRVLFEQPSVRGFAAVVAGAESVGAGVALVPVERAGPVELSFAQQRMWFLHQLEPGSASYHVPALVRLRGRLDVDRLRAALVSVTARHEVLRTVFAEVDGRPVQVVRAEPVVDFGMGELDFTRPFDLEQGPLTRWSLTRAGDDEFLLSLVMHHIVSDGWSVGVLLQEVQAAYAGRSLPELPVQYADFAVWQRQWLESGVLDEQLAYWKTRLAGAAPILDLPTDFPRPAIASYQGAHLHADIDETTTTALTALAQRHDATLFMVLQAVYAAVLARRSGQHDTVVGVPVANRTRTEVENLIGFFVNTLAIRTQVREDEPFTALLAQVRETSLDAFAHQDLPFERLVEDLAPDRDLARNPIFQTMFTLQNAPRRSGDGLEGVEMERLPLEEGTSKFDVSVMVEEGDELRVSLEYATDLFSEGSAQAILDAFLRACQVLVEEPDDVLVGDLSAVSPAERVKLLHEWNDTDRRETLGGIVERVRKHAMTIPDAIAVRDGGAALTYHELATRAARLSERLTDAGVRVGDRVALHLERGVDAIVSVLGVLGAGAAYVPLDVRAPEARRAAVLADSGARVLIGRDLPADTVVVLDDIAPVTPWTSPAGGPHDLAYVIYTSGSTGLPKGAMVHRIGMDNHLLAKIEDLSLTGTDVVVQNASLTFDVSVWQMLSALAVGGSTLVVDDDTALDAVGLFKESAAEGVTILEVVPSLLRATLDAWDTTGEVPSLPALRWLLVTGEALPPDLCSRWLARFPEIPLVNAYGPTECSDDVTHAVITADTPISAVRAPIGRPIRNTRLYVVDELLQLVPVGVPGELVVGGIGVGRGYLNDPARTAAVFVPDPFSDVPGARLYRTGDIVRYLPDGQLEFLGRRDFQVKIRGQRIELGEIEAALRAVDGVSDAVVTAVKDDVAGTRLAAYVTGPVDAITVRAAAAGLLPDAMVPSAVMVLDTLPLTDNGKVDRSSLPAPVFQELAEYVAPKSVHERAVAGLFGEVLGVDRVGLTDDFFGLGGHSLLATQVMARVRERFSVGLPLRVLFEQPSVRGFAAVVAGAESVGAGVALVPVERAGPVELSFAQQRMWFLHQLEPGSASYHVPALVRLRGRLDVDRLRAALVSVTARHEVLRTVFAEVDGRPVQVVRAEPVVDFGMGELDFTRPFDLEQGPLTRWSLTRTGDDEFLLSLVMHHIVSDGWSVGVLLQEVQAAYAGRALPDLPVQYADFAVWQRQWLESGVLDEQLAYWKTRLAGAAPVLDLPTDFPRPAIASYQGAHLRARIDRGTAAGLNDLAQRHDATLFMVLQAVYAAVLARRSGQHDIVVGVPVANRTRTEVENLIGFFVNTLAIRTQVREDEPFTALLAQVRETSLDAFAHQDLPFERLVEDLAPDRDLARNPIFQTMFTLQNAPRRSEAGLQGVEMEQLPLEEGASKFDVSVMVEEGDELRVSLEYATDLFTAETAQAILDAFLRACTILTASPDALVGDLSAVSPAERVKLLREWNDTDRRETLGGIVERVREHAMTIPDAIAVRDDHKALTYRELATRAARLSDRLTAAGVRVGDRVALHLERGVDAVVSVLGVLGAGAAYVPLDVRAPEARRAAVLADSGARVLIGQGLAADTVVVLDDIAPVVPWVSPAGGPDDLAYVIYTSGSTGLPKGAMVHRIGMDNHLLAKIEDLSLTGTDVVVQNASLTFDVSVWQMLSALAVGGCTLVVDDETALDAVGLFRDSAAEGVTVLEVVPSLLRATLDAWDTTGEVPSLPALRWLLVTGEALPPDLCSRWLARFPGIPLVNAYGPTECSDDVTHAVITADTPISAVRAPIGRPIRNTRLYVVDESLQLVPVGVPGELVVGGIGVGRGYLNDPARTAAVFVPDPFSEVAGARLYRTGDIVRYLPDGQLEFLGRRDFQVKIRGQRIELGEIEAALRTITAVTDAVVTAVKDPTAGTRLAAYVTGPVDATAVRAAAAGLLPDAMVPSAVMVLDTLPLTDNGKIDRSALPAPVFHEQSEYVAPVTSHERAVARLFGEVLGIDRVGATDTFFELGGHSLLATQVMARVRERFSVGLPLRVLFEQPSVRGFAAVVAGAESVGAGVALVPVERAGPVELSFAQQRMWFLHQLEPGSASYHVPALVRLRGRLDVDRLRAALVSVTARHEVLRTVFAEVDGRPVQVVRADPVVDFGLGELDFTRPFDLERGPLTRWSLTRTGDDEFLLSLVMHHIVSDGWSIGVLLQEVQAAYAGRSLPELPVQYADFAVWQRQWLESGVLDEQLAYWKTRLAGAAPILDLPTDFPRPAIASYQGAHLHADIDETTTTALTALAQRHDATLFMVLQAVYAAVLARRSGQHDIVVGVPVANRTRTEVENLIGFFVNTLAIRTQVREDEPFTALLAQVRETSLDAFAHQDLPFERLVEDLAPDRDLARNPIFQTMFVLQNAERRTGEDGLQGVEMERLPLEEGTSKFDVSIAVEEADELRVSLEYATDLFTAETAQAILDAFLCACTILTESPDALVGDLSAVSPAERVKLLREWNDTDRRETLGGIVERVREHAMTIPDAIAVRDDHKALTYRELATRAARLSNRLTAAGVKVGDRVALHLERGVDAIVSVLGVLGAGAAYVPLDLRAPEARRTAVLADSGARVLIGRDLPADTVIALDDIAPVTPWTSPAGGPHDLAYVIYTSGSTGLPKGAMVHRIGMDNHLLAKIEDLSLTDTDVVVQNASLTFDVSVWQMLSALAVGGSTLVIDDDTALDAVGLFKESAAEGVTILEVVPSLLRATLDAWDTTGEVPALPALRWLLVTGEALPPDLCSRWLARFPEIPLVNAYGPTECSDDVTHAVITADTPISAVRAPIGRPIRNTRLYVVDEFLQLVPVGVPGELVVGGIGVGRGYLNDPARTAAVFVPDPFSDVPGARLYRTGDIVRYLPDGQLEFLGRRDFQVKIRGQRIELGEIEAALRTITAVTDAVVTAVKDPTAGTRLAAYVTGPVDAAAVRSTASAVLPDAMVPSAVTVLDTLPLTDNGKIDRSALPAPVFHERAEYVPPETVHEHALARLFSEVLGVDRVGLTDDFFGLGGHSLLATQVMARVREQFSVALPLRVLFEQPGLRELAAAVARAQLDQASSDDLADFEDLLAEIENMSDEEVAERLAREQ
ncbi:non-ribosomal peptide synthetase [Actinoplanes missouriensis]|nr:non-ribosomal peptide synthetase [Actinoplanes missouriensis]